jgi:hypothetical protein
MLLLRLGWLGGCRSLLRRLGSSRELRAGRVWRYSCTRASSAAQWAGKQDAQFRPAEGGSWAASVGGPVPGAQPTLQQSDDGSTLDPSGQGGQELGQSRIGLLEDDEAVLGLLDRRCRLSRSLGARPHHAARAIGAS